MRDLPAGTLPCAHAPVGPFPDTVRVGSDAAGTAPDR
jgi:hypothetical protein